MGNIEHVYSKVAILENNGYVVGAVHLNGKPESEYAPLEWCNDEDVLDVDKFGVITVEQYEKAGYKFPAPTDERVQWFGIEDITNDKFNDRHDVTEPDSCSGECCGACGQMSFVDEYIARKSDMMEKVEALAKKAGKAEEGFADWVSDAVKSITEDDVDALMASKHEAIEERDKVLVHALYEVEHSSDDDRLRNMLGVFLDAALGTGKHKPNK